jgi:hypothetical protein
MRTTALFPTCNLHRDKQDMNRGNLLFARYLKAHFERSSYDPDEVASWLNYRTTVPMRSWLNGTTKPPSFILVQLADAMGVDAVELSVGWLIAENSELEQVLQERVLKPLGLRFPTDPDSFSAIE